MLSMRSRLRSASMSVLVSNESAAAVDIHQTPDLGEKRDKLGVADEITGLRPVRLYATQSSGLYPPPQSRTGL